MTFAQMDLPSSRTKCFSSLNESRLPSFSSRNVAASFSRSISCVRRSKVSNLPSSSSVQPSIFCNARLFRIGAASVRSTSVIPAPASSKIVLNCCSLLLSASSLNARSMAMLAMWVTWLMRSNWSCVGFEGLLWNIANVANTWPLRE